jgi:D-serine deaminase-like pyridoxal phosphate-dependent protein
VKISDIDTPALLLDLDKIERNISRLHGHLGSNGIALRPHVKTHKIPALAHMQLATGAVGITTQKVSEAAVFVDAGVRDVLVAFNIVGDAKLDRLSMLARRANISVVADSLVVIDGYAETAARTGCTLDVFIECDTGRVRSGIHEPEEALPLANRIAASRRLRFAGLMSFKGGPPDLDHIRYTDEFYPATKSLLEEHGIEVPLVSVGGTVYAWNAWPRFNPRTVAENRAGAYVFYDRVKVEQGVATLDDCAATLLMTVVSTATKDRVVLDGGSKTMPPDTYFGGADFGHVIDYSDMTVVRLFEEHAVCDVTTATRRPRVGERVRVIPNYINGVIGVVDTAYAVRGDEVVAVWSVAGRGKTT